jgi:hypothetical protein
MNAPGIRDRSLLLGWIAGLIIVCGLVWTLTRPLQARYLQRAVNKVFISMNDSRRLAAPLARPWNTLGPLGIWYSMWDSEDRFLVFALMRDGILIPCGARVSPEGKVEEIIPLGRHAARVVDSVPRGVVNIHIRRIEAAAAEGDGK